MNAPVAMTHSSADTRERGGQAAALRVGVPVAVHHSRWGIQNCNAARSTWSESAILILGAIAANPNLRHPLPESWRRGRVRPMSELVPQAVRDLLAFYNEHCPETRFGDLDIRVLQRAVESIDEAAQRVIEAEEAVAQARAQFREVESGILVKANRTLSFLRIFVEDDETQQAKLESIANGLPSGRRRGKAAAASGSGEPRQRRPRKSKSGAEDANGEATALEAALEKAGLTDDEEPSETEVSEPVSDVEIEATPAAKKTGGKAGK